MNGNLDAKRRELEALLPRRFEDIDCRRLPLFPPAAQAFAAWALCRALQRTVLLVCDGPRTLEEGHQNLLALQPEDAGPPLYLPAREGFASADARPDSVLAAHRLQALCVGLHGDAGGPRIVITCVQALMQQPLSRRALADATSRLAAGAPADRREVLQRLEASGYTFAPEVQDVGQAAVRGGLVDVWPPTEGWPLRIEWFGNEVESIRHFDPVTQCTRDRIEAAVLPPADEWKLLQADRRARGAWTEWLPDPTLVWWCDAESIEAHAQRCEDAARDAAVDNVVQPLAAVHDAFAGRANDLELSSGLDQAAAVPALLPRFDAVQGAGDGAARLAAPDLLEQRRRRLVGDLCRRARRGQTVIVMLETPGARDHFRETLSGAERSCLQIAVGALSSGFICDDLALAVVAEPDLYGPREALGRRYDPGAAARAAPAAGAPVETLRDLQPGDLVVHVEHGLGRYLGLFEIAFSGRRQEVLSVEYADKAKLHIPLAQAHLLSRYVGIGGRHVALHRLGGKRWNREREAAERSILDMAASLLETEAQRNLLAGHAFPQDGVWQHEFEASFPYRETADQARVIDEVRADMQATRPMDRLLCGDAGYGKTEVAMRAAFRAVMDARQVAVLVPTTVLAQQHYRTFRERMGAYPVRIEMLSRFRTGAQRRGIAEGLRDGKVDIVIGTHALLQEGLAFHNLGLVIIDEEQRFGVAHKERLKAMRHMVDVLTMTATPIPRTLYLSLTGARQISLLQTPPRERMAIETLVARKTDEVVRGAILREINRDGQVFYLHNRVMTIDRVGARLRRLVPEASIEIAHGQMATAELASVMRRFVAGDFAVLLCTTIIESGMDIPRANTILIDRADRFGMADLYQLRGRVGRSNRKAYAYFLLPEKGPIDGAARQRLAAITRHAGLGAGFHLAMRDLEIRGGGNLLGAEQSGHIAAVGFGLYCQLLRRSIARLKGETMPPLVNVVLALDFLGLSPRAADETAAAATLPYTFIEDEPLRVDTYRRLAEAATEADVHKLKAELTDRFGPLPPPARRLLTTARIRVAAAAQGLSKVETRGDKIMLHDGRDYVSRAGRFPRLRGRTADRKLMEILRCVRSFKTWAP